MHSLPPEWVEIVNNMCLATMTGAHVSQLLKTLHLPPFLVNELVLYCYRILFIMLVVPIKCLVAGS